MTTTLLRALSAESTVTTVSLDELTIDPRVQRAEGPDSRRVDSMADKFDDRALGLFIVSRRANNALVILDGMHRAATCRKVGYTKYVDARVFEGLTIQEEAALFLLYNTKKDPSAISKFKARVTAGESVANAVAMIIDSYGLTVRQSKDAGSLAAIEAAERVYTTASGVRVAGEYPEVLQGVLSVVTEAWGRDSGAVDRTILAGLGQLIGRYGETADRKRIVAVLRNTTPASLLGRARALKDIQGGTAASALAKIVASEHNKNKRTNLLPEWVWVR